MQNDALSQPVPFSILRGHKLGWHFDPDPEGGGGGGGNNPPMIAKSEADAAFAARDKAKKRAESAVALLAELLGVDADQVDVTESGVSVPELDVLKEKIVAARKSGKTPDQQLAEAEAKFTKKLSDAQKAHKAELDARDNFIRRKLVSAEIRAAAASEQVIDTAIDDVEQLLASRVKVDFTVEGDTLSHKVTVYGEDGTPLLKDGQPGDVKQLVAAVLEKRPYFKKQNRVVGPGAGRGTPPVTTGGPVKTERRTAGQLVFGR